RNESCPAVCCSAWFGLCLPPRQPDVLALEHDMHAVRAVVGEDYLRGVRQPRVGERPVALPRGSRPVALRLLDGDAVWVVAVWHTEDAERILHRLDAGQQLVEPPLLLRGDDGEQQITLGLRCRAPAERAVIDPQGRFAGLALTVAARAGVLEVV